MISGDYSQKWNGDDSVFRKIHDDYYLRLSRFATTLIKDRDEAQFIANGAFIALYKNGPIKPEDKLRNFLYKVTENKCIDHYRKKLKGRIFLNNQKNPEITKQQIEAAMDNAERTYKLYKLIQTLPSEIKKAMTLFYIHELTAEDIAAKEGKSVATIRVQLQRGRELLKELIKIDKLLLIVIQIILFM